jgi:hypothetical protein
MAEIKLSPKAGITGWFSIDDSINKVIINLQANPAVFGLVDLVVPQELVSSTEKTDSPTWLILQDCGLKLRFDSKF